MNILFAENHICTQKNSCRRRSVVGVQKNSMEKNKDGCFRECRFSGYIVKLKATIFTIYTYTRFFQLTQTYTQLQQSHAQMNK